MTLLRVLLPLVLLASLAPLAAAQTIAAPIEGDYEDVYVVSGRVLDGEGRPMPQANLRIELEQEGIRAAPLRAAANCKGDFITSFTLKKVDPRGEVRITLLGDQDRTLAETSVALDPFFRRSDAILRSDEPWPFKCSREMDVFDVSASISVRLLNRTAPYMVGEDEFHARPYGGIVRLRFEAPGGNLLCPPHPQNPEICELFGTDSRGDIRYTFTLDQPFEGGGRAEVILLDNTTLEVPIDPVARIGTRYFETTGQGVPRELYDTTPGGGVLLALLAAGVALVARSHKNRPPK